MEPINSMDLSRLQANSSKDKDPKKLKEACQGFEAIFLATMMKSMRETLPGDSLFGESQAIDIYESMYDQHLTDQLAASGKGIGIAEFLHLELSGGNFTGEDKNSD